MKKRRFLTVMIIPHTEDRPKALKIPILFLRFLAVSAIFSLIIVFRWGYQFNLTNNLNKELQRSSLEGEELIAEYAEYYSSINQELSTLQEKIVAAQDVEEQVREKNNFEQKENYYVEKSLATSLLGKDATLLASAISETKETLEILQEIVPQKEQSLNDLIRQMEDRNEALLSIPSIYPAVGSFTSYFGYRRDPFNGTTSYHDGLDIANSYGTSIYATADGIVTYSGYNGGYGYMIKINHGNGLQTVYGHNSKLLVSKGSFVRKGQLIAYMGSTGRSTGPHVHYEVIKNGVKVNPFSYLK